MNYNSNSSSVVNVVELLRISNTNINNTFNDIIIKSTM